MIPYLFLSFFSLAQALPQRVTLTPTLSASLIAPSVVGTATLPLATPLATGLANLAARSNKYIGCAFDSNHIPDRTYSQLVLGNVNQLTCENCMKWASLEPAPGVFNTTLDADRITDITLINGMTLRGHTLVWHSQLPTWVMAGNFNNATLIQVMQNHITVIMSRYKGRIHTWDVVNEVLNDDGTLRPSVFSQTIGPTFIDIAFFTAKSVDPAPLLAINDFSIEGGGPKSQAMATLVARLKVRGVPIDQIGMQSHLIVGSVPTDLAVTWNTYVGLGVSIAITELDIRMATPVTDIKLQQQANDYMNVVATCLNMPRCLGITFWGLSDKYSWVPSTFAGQDSADLFDQAYNAKPAYAAILRTLSAVAPNTQLTAGGAQSLVSKGMSISCISVAVTLATWLYIG